MINILRYCRFFIPVAGFILASAVFAQTKSEKPQAEGMSAEIIQARLKQVEDSHDLDESLKAKIRDYYRQAAQNSIPPKPGWPAPSRFEQMAASAPADLAATKAELDKLPAKPSLETAEDSALPQIDQLISKKQSELDEHRSAWPNWRPNPSAARAAAAIYPSCPPPPRSGLPNWTNNSRPRPRPTSRPH